MNSGNGPVDEDGVVYEDGTVQEDVGDDVPDDEEMDDDEVFAASLISRSQAEGSVPAGAAPEGAAPRAIREFVHEGPTERLDKILSDELPDFTRNYVQRLISTGYVSLDPASHREPKPAMKVPAGVRVRVVIPPPLKVSLAPEPVPLEFLYEDEHIAVVDKPAGLSVHPAPNQEGATLVNALLYWLDDLSGIAGVERPGIVHRLDKETSGVLVVAKHDVAHQALSYQFRERLVHKTYLAISRGEPREEEGRISFPLGRSLRHTIKQTVREDGKGRPALTDYRVLETFDGYSLIECYPKTGRTHQIRVHLAKIRLPIACDKLYGREKFIYETDLRGERRKKGEQPLMSRHALHAASICLHHPVTREEVTFSAPVHDDMLGLLHMLQRYRSPR